jgi:hypothetical protein
MPEKLLGKNVEEPSSPIEAEAGNFKDFVIIELKKHGSDELAAEIESGNISIELTKRSAIENAKAAQISTERNNRAFDPTSFFLKTAERTAESIIKEPKAFRTMPELLKMQEKARKEKRLHHLVEYYERIKINFPRIKEVGTQNQKNDLKIIMNNLINNLKKIELPAMNDLTNHTVSELEKMISEI